MSMVGGDDGYHNIFGAPKPAPFGAVGAVLDKFVSSPAFPMVAAAIVGGAAGQAFGAGSAATTAVKSAPAIIGAVTGGTAAATIKTGSSPQMADANPIPFIGTNSSNTQLTGTTPGTGTAQLPGQPIIINTAPVTSATQAQAAALPANQSLLYVGLGALLWFLLKGKR